MHGVLNCFWWATASTTACNMGKSCMAFFAFSVHCCDMGMWCMVLLTYYFLHVCLHSCNMGKICMVLFIRICIATQMTLVVFAPAVFFCILSLPRWRLDNHILFLGSCRLSSQYWSRQSGTCKWWWLIVMFAANCCMTFWGTWSFDHICLAKHGGSLYSWAPMIASFWFLVVGKQVLYDSRGTWSFHHIPFDKHGGLVSTEPRWVLEFDAKLTWCHDLDLLPSLIFGCLVIF